MRGYKKGRNAKNASSAVTPEAFASAVSEAVAQALDPISKKLDEVIAGNKTDPMVNVDDSTLSLMGLTTADELGEVMEEAAEMAANSLEENGSPVAAAVIDAGLDTSEVVEELVKGRKARKSAGETLEPVTAEEVAEIIEVVAEEAADGLSEEEVQQLADEGFVDEEAVNTAAAANTGAKRRGKSGSPSRKSAGMQTRQVKQASTPPIQRKYSQLYTQTKESSSQRSQKELSPVVRFARAAKCADYFARGGASGGFADPDRAAWAAQTF